MIVFLFSSVQLCVYVRYGAGREWYSGRAGVLPGVMMKSEHGKRVRAVWKGVILSQIGKTWRH